MLLALATIVGVWAYLAAVLAVWLLLRFGGDRWWFATVILFAPRWPYALPWLVLAPAAAWLRPRLLWPLAVAAIVLLLPIMGLCLPWARCAAAGGPVIRVLTCNVHGQAVDRDRLAALVADTQPDLVALQECSADPPPNWPAGWHTIDAGQLRIASPYPISRVESAQNRHPPSPWPPVNVLRCSVELPQGTIGFCCIHLHTPREGLSEVLDRNTVVNPKRSSQLAAEIVQRRLESEDLQRWLQDWTPTWIAAGDFNMPDDSAIYRDCWARYASAFARTGFGFGYTKWTPVGCWQYGSRIDHVLAGPGIKPRRAWVGPDVGSDHLPVVAELELR